ncbi:MAG: hypothetical protein WDA28_12770 [Castellaniella sp.]
MSSIDNPTSEFLNIFKADPAALIAKYGHQLNLRNQNFAKYRQQANELIAKYDLAGFSPRAQIDVETDVHKAYFLPLYYSPAEPEILQRHFQTIDDLAAKHDQLQPGKQVFSSIASADQTFELTTQQILFSKWGGLTNTLADIDMAQTQMIEFAAAQEIFAQEQAAAAQAKLRKRADEKAKQKLRKKAIRRRR